ncbi:hypothetical protein FIBSPDRAFT_69404 [Athelia psychrophila]|uniref:Uncharacterized protein n=1 Tax=Athelia psychrophila TaxID=1759441 RepID=A0A166TS92_9AGAM|nr:hypothetical protein FIBSPDRAFT_69404 [Fibularhizoctonia sp. CBS 109695]
MSSAGPVFSTTNAQIHNINGNVKYILSEDNDCSRQNIQVAGCSGQLRRLSGTAGEASPADRYLICQERRLYYTRYFGSMDFRAAEKQSYGEPVSLSQLRIGQDRDLLNAKLDCHRG